jgi:hypothetical protein
MADDRKQISKGHSLPEQPKVGSGGKRCETCGLPTHYYRTLRDAQAENARLRHEHALEKARLRGLHREEEQRRYKVEAENARLLDAIMQAHARTGTGEVRRILAEALAGGPAEGEGS